MARVIAKASGLGRSPTKFRPILAVVRGKRALDALQILRFMPSPAAFDVAKVLRSAIANAQNNHRMFTGNLKIVDVRADEGPRLRRFKARSRGRVNPIIHRSSHITIAVDEEA
jgi:large subunit ribosomal protein L22